MNITTRKAAVAGMFYPGDPDHLSAQIQSFLDVVPPLKCGHPLGFIVPHAGYSYSGPVAAYAYKCLVGGSFEKVVILAPSHFDSFDGLSLYSGQGLETPLGVVTVAKRDQEALVQTEGVACSEIGFGQEHSLEVQLPFLQHVLQPGWVVVPIVMGHQRRETVQLASRVLGRYLARKDMMIIISSDLSHYYSYREARRMDERFCKLVRSGDLSALWQAYVSHEVEACGFGPIFAFLTALAERTDVSVEILDYRNSGDTSGSKDQVVGYSAVGAFSKSK